MKFCYSMRTLLCSGNGRSRVLSRLIALCRKSAMDKWGLDPLYWSFVKVFIVQVHQLSLFEGTADTHMLYGRPISRVEVVGVVVSVKQHARFVKYYIDDGTGTLLPASGLALASSANDP